MIFENHEIVHAFLRTLESPSVSDQNGEPANVVDVVHEVALAARAIASSITDQGACACEDQHGQRVGCLTEAMMSMSRSITELAEAIRESRRDVD